MRDPIAISSTNPPHGGQLIDLMAARPRLAECLDASLRYPSVIVTPQQRCDLELLVTGAFSPLRGFMHSRDYESVCRSMRLTDGTLWPIPITFDVPAADARAWSSGTIVTLCDGDGSLLALLHVNDIWQPDLRAESIEVFGTDSDEHPGVARRLALRDHLYVGGTIEGIELPRHYDFRHLRLTPAEARADFAQRGWSSVVAFQTRNPLHRAHVELTLRAARATGANVFIHPTVGPTKPGDIDHYTRVRCYQAALQHYPSGTAALALLPLAMRMAGPREAMWHAIIRKNYGCTHLIVGRDHAGPGRDSRGIPFYDPYAAQQLVHTHERELGITPVPFKMLAYAPELDQFVTEDEVETGAKTLTISGAELRTRLARGEALPDWFTFPEVADELQHAAQPATSRGAAIFLTGLSGAGKSTIANILLAQMLEGRMRRAVTLLDGDVVRQTLSSELGFSRDHRNLNIRRIALVAAEVAKHGGIAICAPIAPYDEARRQARAMVSECGTFLLVHVRAPIDLCERRDPKGLYAKARNGLLPNFTGVSDPYEEPTDADVVVDTAIVSAEGGAALVLDELERRGLIASKRAGASYSRAICAKVS